MSERDDAREELVKNYFLKALKEKVVEAAIKRVLGAALKVGAFKLWLVSFIAAELWDELGRPLALWAIRKGLLGIDITKGKVIVARINKARDEGNQTEYDSAVDDLFR